MSAATVLTPPPLPVAIPTGAVTPPPAGVLPQPPAKTGAPVMIASAELFRFSRADCRALVSLGILPEGDPVELLDGLLVKKMPKNRPHVIATRQVQDALGGVLPAGWSISVQDPVGLDESEPEPDVFVFRGRHRDYPTDHPTAADAPLVVEVADTSLSRDRTWKRSIYARNGIPTYWIVNLVDRTLEVYSAPVAGEYTQSVTLTAADRADVVFGGTIVGSVAVAELLP